jgi:hypothetical protein
MRTEEPGQKVRHAAGVLPFILVGEERLRAHETLRELCCCNPGEEVPAERDLQLLQWVERDPSLFIEPIPRRNPHSLFASAWEVNRSWWGTWAYRAAVVGAEKTLHAIIGAGVHPDDGNVFSTRPTWLWWRHPDRLQALLAAGADPDSTQQLERPGGFRADPNASLIRTCLRDLSMEAPIMLDSAPLAEEEVPQRLATLAHRVASAGILLTAGAKKLDPVGVDVHFDDGDVAKRADEAQTAIALAGEAFVRLRAFQVERSLVEALIRRLGAAGASASRLSGANQLSPVTMAVRAGDVAAFELYLELGASANDANLVRKAKNRSNRMSLEAVKPLLDEAFSAGGDEFKAQVTQALMRHVARSTPTPDAPAPKSRRSARVV